MYYPIQIPYVLDKAFSESIQYTEEIITNFQDFNICLWEMQPVSNKVGIVENIIVADGCIDLVADYSAKNIGFSGMSKTNFNFKISLPNYYLGLRLKPGAFHTITKLPAKKAMDNFLPINVFDKNFNTELFFSLSFSEGKAFIKNYINTLINDKKSSEFMVLFDKINNDIPNSVSEIYKILNYSERQCQRLFIKNFGLSPQMVLCILRFQKCLKSLTSEKLSPKDVIDISNYYDQSHFINDFRRNIGLTPFELMKKYNS